jgi:hypothetical protein
MVAPHPPFNRLSLHQQAKLWKKLEFRSEVSLPWFQRFKINLWLKAAIDSSSRANQFELGSDPDSVS